MHLRQRIQEWIPPGAASALAAFVLSADLPSQGEIFVQDAPEAVLDAFDIRDAKVMDIDVPTELGDHLGFEIEIDGVRQRVIVSRHSLYGPDAFVVVDGGLGPIRPTPHPSTRSRARCPVCPTASSQRRSEISRSPPSCGCRISPPTAIEPTRRKLSSSPRRQHVIYARSEVEIDPSVRCGSHDEEHDGEEHDEEGHRTAAASGTESYEVEIATDLTNSWVTHHGGLFEAIDEAMAMLNAVDAIYQRDANVCIRVTAHLARIAPVYSPTESTGELLGEMRSRWNSFHQNIPRDIAHLFTAAVRSPA